MLIEEELRQFEILDKWFQSPLGIFIAHEFSAVFNSLSQILRGEDLLQLGSCGSNLWLQNIKYENKWIASPIHSANNYQVECSLGLLPFARNSLNCILAPLTLEPFGTSSILIDEIDRVLRPMGYAVIMSINPWSTWGAALKCGLVHCYNGGKIKMHSPYLLDRIFAQRGFRQVSLINFCYLPPINNQKIIDKLSFFNEVGKMLWPFPAGFYCYVAQKYEYIRPSLLKSKITTIPAGVPASF